MSDSRPKIIPLVVVGGLIQTAYCSVCGDNLPVERTLNSPEQQRAKLEEAFERHLRARHSEHLRNQNTDL